MRIPESLDEYQHMLNAAGWQQQKKRKVGTKMRSQNPQEFYGSLIDILSNRVEELQKEIETIEGLEKKLPTHGLRSKILKNQISEHRSLIGEAEKAVKAAG